MGTTNLSSTPNIQQLYHDSGRELMMPVRLAASSLSGFTSFSVYIGRSGDDDSNNRNGTTSSDQAGERRM